MKSWVRNEESAISGLDAAGTETVARVYAGEGATAQGDVDVADGLRCQWAAAAMTERVVVRRGAYHDSVTLMQVSRQAEGLPGVAAAAAVAATPVNLELLARQGFAVDAERLGPNDLVLCVRADGEEAAEAALEAIGRLLAAGPAGGDGGTGRAAAAPRSLRSAARASSGRR